MLFKQKLIPGTLIKRYKRFLVDIRLDSGERITAHSANSGSMKGLLKEGNRVYLSYHDIPSRKLKYTWEIVKAGRVLVGINTHLPNVLVEEGIRNGVIEELQGYAELKREVKYGKNSRIDILLKSKFTDSLSPRGGGLGRGGGNHLCYVEVKNVTLVEGKTAFFPDAITERGRKHLEELMVMVEQGHRAVLCYVLQRADGNIIAPANHIDAKYAQTLKRAFKNGVEILAYRARVNPKKIEIFKKVRVKI